MGWVCSPAFGCRAALPQAWTEFLLHIPAVPGISKAGATHPSSSPLFSRISKRRRGVSSCQAPQLQGSSQAIPIPTQMHQSSFSCSLHQGRALLRHPRTKLSPSHAMPAPTPAFILLIQIHQKLHTCRELHYAGDGTAAAPALHGE